MTTAPLFHEPTDPAEPVAPIAIDTDDLENVAARYGLRIELAGNLAYLKLDNLIFTAPIVASEWVA